MHINELLKNYLYDNQEYIVWNDNKLYIYGIKKIIFLGKEKIILDLINNTLEIRGDNLRAIKSGDKELVIKGDVYDIKK